MKKVALSNKIPMKVDLHVHTKTGSDGNLTVEEIFQEAKKRHIDFLSITDHDSISCQEKAVQLAHEYGISYITGVELNVALQYQNRKPISLDFLAYNFNPRNAQLNNKLQILRNHREKRARKILKNLNVELIKNGIMPLTKKDFQNIRENVDGAFGRPHIANYLISKKIAKDKQEAFDKYLVKCDVPKYPLQISEASNLIKNAGGILVLAHPNDPNGTSLSAVSSNMKDHAFVIENYILDYIDGIECWHSRHDASSTSFYLAFAEKHKLIVTGGSDCHQKPILLGTVTIPDFAADSIRGRIHPRLF